MKGQPISPEQKAKMAEGRKRAAVERRAAKLDRPSAALPPTLAELGLKAELEDDYTGLLSAEEKAAIRAQVREQINREQKEAAKLAFKEEALFEARRETGTVPVDEERERRLAELRPIRIVLPSLKTPTGREIPPDPIIIDQRVFANGWSGMVTQAQWETIVDVMNRAWMHMAQVDGRSRTYYNGAMGQVMMMPHYDPAAERPVYQGGYALGGGSRLV